MDAPIDTTVCEKCGSSIELEGRLLIGEVFECPSCRATLEVAMLEPLTLEPFARVEEDPQELVKGLQHFDLL